MNTNTKFQYKYRSLLALTALTGMIQPAPAAPASAKPAPAKPAMLPGFTQTYDKPYVQVKTEAGTIRLSVYGPDIVRSQVFQGEEPEQRWNPAVVAEPLATGFTFSDGKTEAVLQTPKMRVVVDKSSGQIAFYDAAGKLLTKTGAERGGCNIENDADGGVSQQFVMSKGEHLYGVGSYVNGLPYMNRTAATLSQNNMEDAGHVLMSDRGYGMFWNNPSGGEFKALGDDHVLLSDKNVKTEDGRPGFAPQYFPADSNLKQQWAGKFLQGKLSSTIDITAENAEVDIMQSDFDMAATGKPAVKPAGAGGGMTLLYRGTLRTPDRTGWYYFNVGNAGRGARFVVDGERVVERRIPHAFAWNGGRKWLEGNKDYPYELYYSSLGKPALQVYWNPSGSETTQYSWKGDRWKTSDYFVFAGAKSDEIMKGFYTVTGKPSIMPKWAMGFIHSQAIPFGKTQPDGFTREDYLKLINGYRDKQIPNDVIVQDFQWWTAMGSHIFRPDSYPEPYADRIKLVQDAEFKLMLSVWPIFEDKPTDRYKGELTAADLKNRNELKDKGLLIGNWVDFVKPEARQVFWRQVADAVYNKTTRVDSFWLDASEGGAKDPRYSNAFPLLDSMTFDEGARATFPDKRMFILGRSMYPGMQRYDTAMWSGDIGNDFWTLQRQVSVGLSTSVCGIPYWSTDIGGFGGGFSLDPDYANGKNPNDPVYREVVARWFQYGMFCPIFRVHRAADNSAPWFYGDQVEKILADTIKFRYRLLPYVYSLSQTTRDEGVNPMRPLFMDFGSDPKTLDITQQFMYGPSFLVCPVTKPMYNPYQPNVGGKISPVAVTDPATAAVQSWPVYLPKGADWFDFHTGQKFDGGQMIKSPAPLDLMPLFVRAGSIVPMGKVIQNTTSGRQNELELRIYPGADADFVLYDDDGVSYDYEKGASSSISLHWDDVAGKLTIGERQGKFKSMPEKLVFKPVLVGKGKGVGSLTEYSSTKPISYTGKKVETPVTALSSLLVTSAPVQTATSKVPVQSAIRATTLTLEFSDESEKHTLPDVRGVVLRSSPLPNKVLNEPV